MSSHPFFLISVMTLRTASMRTWSPSGGVCYSISLRARSAKSLPHPGGAGDRSHQVGSQYLHLRPPGRQALAGLRAWVQARNTEGGFRTVASWGAEPVTLGGHFLADGT